MALQEQWCLLRIGWIGIIMGWLCLILAQMWRHDVPLRVTSLGGMGIAVGLALYFRARYKEV